MKPQAVSEAIRRHYENHGWVEHGGNTRDALENEDLRDHASEYVSLCRQRILRYLPQGGGDKILDFASGPIQYPEYETYSRAFTKRHCVDLSPRALTMAKEKMGDHVETHCGDFLDLELPSDFDAILCLHTLYHIHAHRQEEVVDRLLSMGRPGAPVIIIYSNPDGLLQRIARRIKGPPQPVQNFYVHSHPISWWKRFEDRASVELYPWRSFSASHQKKLIPDHAVGRWIFRRLFSMEDRFPDFFIRHFKFYSVVLKARG